MLRLLYGMLWHVALPFALLRLWWRARREPGYLLHVGERLGRYAALAEPAVPRIWVHAVSVGETRAAQPLIEALLQRFPQHRLLLTHMTPTGRRTGAELFGRQPRVEQAYLPYDLPWAVSRFLRHYRPAFGALMETEVWPNVVAGARARGVPLFLVNARLSPRSYRRTARFGKAAVEMFGGLAGIFAQTSGDAERYRALGIGDVVVTGNLKFDMTAPPALVAQGERLRHAFGAHGVWMAGSTREGEESLLLDALKRHRANAVQATALILVPRHPQRFDDVAALVQRAGLTLQRRSQCGPDAHGVWPAIDADVLLGDSMGEMPMYFAASDVAFIGGSLLPLGGQNLIEACAVGTPVLVGPHTFNFAQATEDAIAAGACLRLDDADGVIDAVMTLLVDSSRRKRMREAALAFALAHRGATERTVALLAADTGN